MDNVINVMRHQSVFDPSKHDYPIHIIGAGATGSRVFAALVELGMKKIHVYDPDVIEEHNLANQIYNAGDVGDFKVVGCRTFLKNKLGLSNEESAPESFKFYQRRVATSYINDPHNIKGGVVFILTDTMDSRRTIFNALVKRCQDVNEETSRAEYAPLLIIETRMGSTHGSIFTINPFDTIQNKQWESTLVDDTDPDNIELSPCGTTLSVGTTASLIANYAVWQMMQFFVDPVGMQPRIDLFFKPTLTITSPAIAA